MGCVCVRCRADVYAGGAGFNRGGMAMRFTTVGHGVCALVSSALALGLMWGVAVVAAAQNPQMNETAAERDARMEWWREARFGLFIHWGVYSVPGGEHKGKRTDSISEWIMHDLKIPQAEYAAYAGQFNPVKYDADAWVRLAKEAGMKYIVITSKHHDGFAMYDSAVSDYNIVDATPFDRDPLKELAEACRKHGLKLGFYHSQAQDWNHPGGAYAGMEKEPYWDPSVERESMEQYIDEKAVPQVRELLDAYPDLAIMWWDTPVAMTEPLAQKLHDLLKTHPHIIENNRLYSPWPGDFTTPEQHIPPTGLDYDWEACMTMNTSWGYKYFDDKWKSTEMLVRNLVDIASKGGNYLLNVGPTSEGEIPAPSVERLHEIGAWMKVNGDSIYGTTASPFTWLPWGRCTKKVRDDGATLYLHVFDWPQDGRLEVLGLRNQVRAAHLLADNTALEISTDGDWPVVSVPAGAPNALDSVVVLEIAGPLDVESMLPMQDADGKVVLPAYMALIHNMGYGVHLQLRGRGADAVIGEWVEGRAWLNWVFDVNAPGAFDVFVTFAAADEGNALEVKCGDATLAGALPATGGAEAFERVKLGSITITDAGQHSLEIRPKQDTWKGIQLKSVELVPCAK